MTAGNSTAATAHQAWQQMPKLNTPIVDERGYATSALARFFTTLWLKSGSNGRMLGDASSIQNAVTFAQEATAAGAPLTAYNTLTGEELGVIQLQDVPGGPEVVQTLAASPFVFTAPHEGMLLVNGGKTEFSRDAGTTWYQGSLVGGFIPVQKADMVRVSWSSAYAPSPVVYFPIGGLPPP